MKRGAGKSILVEAIGLILGGRAQAQMVRGGEKEAVVEAVFETEPDLRLKRLLQEAGLDGGDPLMIRRHISAEGKSRIYVNGRMATLAQLESISPFLIDLSGQHAQQILLNEENHLNLLDSFLATQETKPKAPESPLRALSEAYRQAYQHYSSIKAEIDALEAKSRELAQKADFIRFQVQEIDAAKLQDAEEEEKLAAEKKRLKNVGQIHQTVSQAAQGIYSGDRSVLEEVESLLAKLEKISDLDPALKEGIDCLSQARIPLAEGGRFFDRYVKGLSADPARLEEIESRLYQLQQIKRKYGGELSEAQAFGEKMKAELSMLENLDDILAGKNLELEKAGQKAVDLAKQLSKRRIQGAKSLEKVIALELADLSMPQVKFHIAVESPSPLTAAACHAQGCDQVRFDMSANPGEKPRPLAQIASGGELSRILLAIKKVLGGSAPTYIFDEIDTGIGGGVAEVVGKKMKEIAGSHQVLCVTHLAQIASKAQAHYLILKAVESGRTKTQVKALEKAPEREAEIARMLGGVTITSKARAHAREMLGF